MAFCQKCGQQIEDTANNCPYCGAVNVSNPNTKQNNFAQKVKKLNYKNIGILVGGLAAIVIVIVLIVSIFGNGYKKAIDNYIDSSFFGNEKATKKLIPQETWEFIEDEYDLDFDDVYELVEKAADSNLDYYEDEYGKKIKITYSIEDKEVLEKDDDEYDSIKNTLKEFDIKKKDIKKIVKLEVEFLIEGKDDEDDFERDLYLVKIGSKWYVNVGIEELIYTARYNSNNY